MMQTGILEHFERRYPAVNGTCSMMKEETRSARALTLQEVAAAFVVLAAGISTAISVLLLEVIVQNIRKRKGPQSESHIPDSKICELED